ncbi:MAG: DUF5320 domain-containing protein [Bacilli bacterium]|nr:DUF5320 domain-containing protein [Bacilli bacterium]
MPRRDGTGPAGMGPMTGWGMGRCQGNRAYSGRRGFRPLYTPEFNQNRYSKDDLAYQKKILEEELKQINEQLNQ